MEVADGGPCVANSSSPTSNSASPLSPSNVSLKPNVNRAKTKRWVEAKQYSYDGNDWGDDDEEEEDEEYEEEQPPAVAPQQAYKSLQRPGDRPSMLGKDRSKSTDQVLGVDPESASGNQSQSADGRGAAAPFVRPADIYKRMREDREKDGLPAASRGNTEPFSTTPPRASAGALQSTAGGSPMGGRGRPGVADGKRLSEINTDLAGGSSNSSSIPAVQEPEEQRSLQHNPSVGFRSAVNQAFDVPETPASTADSVARSNSDSTSAVSPIMTNRGYSEGKTPTIAEEEGEMTPKEGPDGNIIFKPGHRRDLSVPSPGNSPSRTPKITDNETPASAYPQISSSAAAVEESAEDPVPPLQQNKRSAIQFPSAPAKDLPAPLRFGSNQTSVNPSVEAPQHYDTPAVVVPSLSTETSPQDSENDRLRKEIIKTLSRENSPSNGAEQEVRNSIVPSEYETYWSQDSARSPEELRGPEQNADLASNEEKAPAVGPPPAPWQGGQPKLTKKFSWESSEEDEDSQPPPNELMQDPPIPGQLPPDETATPPATGIGTGTETKSTPEKPKLTIIPPSAGDESSIMSGQHLPEPVQSEAADVAATKSPPPTFTATNFSHEPILGFRDILGIKSTDERVRQFDRTRTQFEAIDTGLNHWIQFTLQTHPEHGDIVAQNSKLTVAAPKGKGKFPKLPSFSNFGVSSSGNPEGPPSGHGHVRRSSAPMNKQQVEQRSKDILHTAGMLGGRAGEAAKGFFSRGRSKFKSNGEKVDA